MVWKDKYTMLFGYAFHATSLVSLINRPFSLDGDLIEFNDTKKMSQPRNKETEDYISGKFG